jgi:murein L,D-transpeptidase YafK
MKSAIISILLGSLFFSQTSFILKQQDDLYNFASQNTYYLIISKSDHAIRLYDSADNFLAQYPAVFGNADLGDKLMKGDKKTPEGIFHITHKRKHEKWDCFLAIDYPNKESYEKFNRRKAYGLIPPNAQIGGDIGIHGTWPNEDFAIDQNQNWTEGCVSTKNKYIEQLFAILPVGTRIEILP